MPEKRLCNCAMASGETLDISKSNLPKQECLSALSKVYTVLGDSVNTKIAFALFQSEMCVCDISELLDLPESTITHQLGILEKYGLVKHNTKDNATLYTIDNHHISTILTEGFTHICHKSL